MTIETREQIKRLEEVGKSLVNAFRGIKYGAGLDNAELKFTHADGLIYEVIIKKL